MTRRSNKTHEPAGTAHRPSSQAHCRKFRDLLTAFVAKELSDAQASLVREHLRQCPHCLHAARQTKQAFELLRAAGQLPATTPVRLSDDRRARIMSAYAQPVLTWFRMNALMLAGILIALLLVFALVATIVTTWRQQPQPDESQAMTVELPMTFLNEEPLEPANTNVDLDPASAIAPLMPEAPTSDIGHASPILPVLPDKDEP